MQRPAYDTRANDVWALGVILLSMISGHNPWNTADHADPCYVAYRRNPNFLRDMLPISESANYILFRLFQRERDGRITLPRLRNAIRTADTFFMGPMDIMHGDGYLRDVARSYFGKSPYQAYYLAGGAASEGGSVEDVVMRSSSGSDGDVESGSDDESLSTMATYGDEEAATCSSSTTLETDGPDTPELRAMELYDDASRLPNADFAPPAFHAASPAHKAMEVSVVARPSLLRRFMDRFRVE